MSPELLGNNESHKAAVAAFLSPNLFPELLGTGYGLPEIPSLVERTVENVAIAEAELKRLMDKWGDEFNQAVEEGTDDRKRGEFNTANAVLAGRVGFCNIVIGFKRDRWLT